MGLGSQFNFKQVEVVKGSSSLNNSKLPTGTFGHHHQNGAPPHTTSPIGNYSSGMEPQIISRTDPLQAGNMGGYVVGGAGNVSSGNTIVFEDIDPLNFSKGHNIF